MYKKFFPRVFPAAETLRIMGSSAQGRLGPEINVLVWNIYKGQRPGWETDFQEIVKDKDLVLLQEAVLNTRYDPIFVNSEKMEWVMARAHGHAVTLAETGVKTGCVVKSSRQNFYMSPSVEPVLKTPKMLLATSYPLAGTDKSLLVVNIHAINFVSYVNFARQMNQVVEAMEHHEGPVLLAGDFNTWNRMRYNNLREIAIKMNLTELGLVRKMNFYHLNRDLDHVFYRGLTAENAEISFNVRSSDHYPISVRFRTDL